MKIDYLLPVASVSIALTETAPWYWCVTGVTFQPGHAIDAVAVARYIKALEAELNKRETHH